MVCYLCILTAQPYDHRLIWIIFECNLYCKKIELKRCDNTPVSQARAKNRVYEFVNLLDKEFPLIISDKCI